jgi:glycosyltransferase involved in cell wall biosynthesis
MKTSSIAIIIPVFNVENVVNDTLLSVKNQKLQADEVIIINDGSTDNSLNIIKRFKDLPGWRIIQTSNQGLGLTRNLGRSISNSEYVHFLDSDDVVKSDFILRMHQIIKKYNYPDMILFSGETFNAGENNKKPNLKFSFNGQYFRNSKLITKLVKKKEYFPQVSRYLTKTLLWSKNNLDYPEGVGQDDAVFFPLLTLSENIVVTSDIFYSYRVGRPGSVTSKTPDTTYAIDYQNLIKSTLKFMTINHDLIKPDISAWNYRLERRGLKYISMCLKTKTSISWKILFIILCKIKSITFLFKSLWRILRYFFRYRIKIK